MRFRVFISALLLAIGTPGAPAADDPIERLRDFLTFSAFDGAFRVRFSGTVDLEGYHLQQPPPGLIYTDRHNLFSPRLTLFLDSQIGSHVYAFAQARLDRGFDPSVGAAEVRLDEYALRFTPWDDGRFSLQVGKFSTVAGRWAQRHLSWDNPFITAPVPYGNLTGIWDSDAAAGVDELLSWGYVPYEGVNNYVHSYADKNMRVPIVWGPSYASGVSAAGHFGKFDYAAEVKNASLSSRPEYWDVTALNFANPTYTMRLGFRPNEAWNFGVSASRGAYLVPEAAPTLPVGRFIGDFHEEVLAQDISFEWHHLQLWAELFEARFQVPHVGNADTFSYFVEAKYKFAPQLFGALRWNQQIYATIKDGEMRVPWGNDLWRVDAALGYRFTPSTQVKLQYSFQHEDNAPRYISSLLAAQFTLRF